MKSLEHTRKKKRKKVGGSFPGASARAQQVAKMATMYYRPYTSSVSACVSVLPAKPVVCQSSRQIARFTARRECYQNFQGNIDARTLCKT